VLYSFMANLFFKFCYYNTDTWDDVIPMEENNHSAEVYYRFATLGSDDFSEKLNELRELLGLELEVIDGLDDDFGYLIGDDWDDETGAAMPAFGRRAAKMLKKEDLLQAIYRVHAATELGHFVFDWSVLPDDFPANDAEWLKKQYSVMPYNKSYNVEYDGGKLMNGFLDFVKNNSSKDKCKMLFIYGSNDPWSGAAIPDPDASDPCVKKHIVANGVHSDDLNNPQKYSEEERDWIMTTVKQMLQ